MAIVGEPLDAFVLRQVENRQKFFGQNPRNDQFLQLEASRTAWVKLASGVSVEDIPKDPFPGLKNSLLKYPKNYVLFNGTSNKSRNNRVGIGSEESYDTWDDRYGIVPMPGIMSLDVKAKNRGSLKEANIKIKCFSKKQFDVIDHLYLRLGYDMLIEYGWSHYIVGPEQWAKMSYTLINHQWWQSDKDDERDVRYWLDQIQGMRQQYRACYDGFFGKVTNFDWSVNTDGSYDITIKLITHGDVIEAISIPVSDQKSSTNTKMQVNDYINKLIYNDAALDTCYSSAFYQPNTWNYNALSYMTIEKGIDMLSQHVKNIQFIGRGIANNLLYQFGMHARNVYNNDPSVTPSQVDNFNAQRNYYYNNWIYFNTVTMVRPGIDTGGGLSIGAYGSYKNQDWNKTFLSTLLNTNKLAGYTFFSAIKGDKAANGKSYQDAFVMLSKVNTPTKFGSSSKKALYQMHSHLGIRFQYILYYLNKYVIKELPNGKKQNPIRWKDDIPMYCVQGTNLVNSYNPSTVIIKKFSWNCTTYAQISSVWIDIYGIFQSPSPGMGWLTDNGIEDAHFVVPNPTPEDPNATLEFLNGKNIYLHSQFILELLNQNIKGERDAKLDVFSFLKDICDEINNAFCNVNHLEPVIDDQTNELYIIDNTNHPNREQLFKYFYPDKPYTKPTSGQLLQMFGYRGIKEGDKTTLVTNFVRDFKLKTKISKELASMITIGATAKGSTVGENATAFSRFNQGLVNRFGKEYSVPNSSTTVGKQTAVQVFGETIRTFNSAKDMLGYNIRTGTNLDECFFVVTQPDKCRKNISTMTDVYKELNARAYKDQNAGSPDIGFLPFTLEIDVDGISGYKIYNQLNASLTFLPSNYDTAMEFILSGVDHKISDNDWVTTLKTIAVPKSLDETLPRDVDPGDPGTDTSPTGSIPPPPTGSISPSGSIPCWIEKSIQEIGVTAILGTGSNQNNDIVTRYHDAAGSPAVDDVFWCSSYMNWLLDNCGYEHTDSKASRHFRGNWKDGNGINHGIVPFYGAIVTWKNNSNASRGHVSCIIAKKLDGAGNVKTIYCLGGNQSIQVRVSPYSWPNPGSKTFVNFSSPSDYTPPATGWDTIPTVNNVYEAYETLGYDRNKVSNSMGRIKNAYRRYERSSFGS